MRAQLETDLVISQTKVTCQHSVEHVALQQRCKGPVLFRPQTVWLQVFSWPSRQHTGIPGTTGVANGSDMESVEYMLQSVWLGAVLQVTNF
ncbi:hypothetical protein TNCV_2624231 [Trichonephila clavipes]|nr:hypothetical protein TNCV_2624231 [Trichonephila clavipes]